MMKSFVTPGKGGVYIAIKLQPRASKTLIGAAVGSELKISVSAPPVDAAANQALVDLLAKELDFPRSTIQIVRGQTSRHKTVFVAGASAEQVLDRLAKITG